MTYQDALQYLNSFINFEKQNSYDYNKSFRLDRMKKLCANLGDPQAGIRSIHVAGTKGKGSTSAFIYSIIKSAGFKAGLYTSPHLVSFRERIMVNDKLIGEDAVCSLLESVKGAVEDIPDEEFSFFEVYTALSFLYFKKEKVDIAVYETGLGGRLDATNVIMPLVSVITPISYEHTDKLGHTLTEIALEKAGIIKDNGICVSAPQEEEVYRAMEGVCKERGAKLITAGKDIRFKEEEMTDEGSIFSVCGLSGRYDGLKTSLLGPHQVVNASTAIGAVECLGYSGIKITSETIASGVKNARWPGRLEVMARNPMIILDGAQNRASAKALAGSVKKIFKYGNIVLVLGVSKDKDIAGILDEMIPISRSVILTRAKILERAMEPSVIRKNIINYPGSITLTYTVKEAIEEAVEIAKPVDLILVTGSLFVVGEAREILAREEKS